MTGNGETRMLCAYCRRDTWYGSGAWYGAVWVCNDCTEGRRRPDGD